MLSQSHRYVYVCEFGVKTLYSRFEPPTLLDLINSLQELLRDGVDLTNDITNQKRISLREIREQGSNVCLLFRLTDPDIPDNILENENGQLRVAARNDGEAPAVSAHVVLNVDGGYDLRRAYPAVIENVDYLSRSLIQWALNKIFEEHFTESREVEERLKEYSPRVEIRGHQSRTISNVLRTGGRLQGLKFLTARVQDDGFGEDAYAVTTTSEVHINVANRPRGLPAVDWVRGKVEEYRGQDLRDARIVIEDASGRTKTAKMDLQLQDVTENFFIAQELVDDFEEPLTVCEPVIRNDVFDKMVEKLPRQ